MSAASVSYLVIGGTTAIAIADSSSVNVPDGQRFRISLTTTTGIRKWTLSSSSGWTCTCNAPGAFAELIPRIAPMTQETWTSSVWDGIKTTVATFTLKGVDQAGYCTPEQFGAVGDAVINVGGTDDTAAFNAAFAAMTAGLYKCLQLSGKTYLISSTLTLPAGCTMRGMGDGSVIMTNTNTTLVKAGGDECVFEDFKLCGNSFNPLQNGLDTNSNSFVRIQNVSVGPFMGNDGIKVTGPGTAANIGPIIVNCRVRNCAGVAYNVAGQQYTQIADCKSYGCGEGIKISAGNCLITNCDFALDTIACEITTGDGNDAHCVFSGCYFNHAVTTAIKIGAIVNGAFFRGCNIYYLDIALTSSTGVIFEGCTIDVDTIHLDGSTGTQFINCTWPFANGNVITPNYNSHASTEIWDNNFRLDGTPFMCGYVSKTPANGANTLSYAESYAETLDLLAGASAGVTINNVRPPKKNNRVLVRNNTSQTVTFGWLSGSTVTLATATSAWIGADGTNAVKLMAGT